MLSRHRQARPRPHNEARNLRRQGRGLFRSQWFNRHKLQLQTTILDAIEESLISPGMVNQPLTIPGMATQVITTLDVGKLPTAIATITRRLCAATGMSGTTAIGGNNTISLSC